MSTETYKKSLTNSQNLVYWVMITVGTISRAGHGCAMPFFCPTRDIKEKNMNNKKSIHEFHRHYGAWWMKKIVTVGHGVCPTVSIKENGDDGYGWSVVDGVISRARAREINRGKNPFPGWVRKTPKGGVAVS